MQTSLTQEDHREVGGFCQVSVFGTALLIAPLSVSVLLLTGASQSSADNPSETAAVTEVSLGFAFANLIT